MDNDNRFNETNEEFCGTEFEKEEEKEDTLNQRLLEKFLRFEDLLHRYQNFHFRNFGPLGNPHRGQGRVLSFLNLKPKMTQKELGYLLDMRNQSLGELLNKLELKGLIVREPSAEDRRTMVIRLTEEGKKAAEFSEMDEKDVTDKIFEVLQDMEKLQLEGELSRLIEAMEKQLVKEGADERIFDQTAAGRFLDAVKNKAKDIPVADWLQSAYDGAKRGVKNWEESHKEDNSGNSGDAVDKESENASGSNGGCCRKEEKSSDGEGSGGAEAANGNPCSDSCECKNDSEGTGCNEVNSESNKDCNDTTDKDDQSSNDIYGQY